MLIGLFSVVKKGKPAAGCKPVAEMIASWKPSIAVLEMMKAALGT